MMSYTSMRALLEANGDDLAADESVRCVAPSLVPRAFA